MTREGYWNEVALAARRNKVAEEFIDLAERISTLMPHDRDRDDISILVEMSASYRELSKLLEKLDR